MDTDIDRDINLDIDRDKDVDRDILHIYIYVYKQENINKKSVYYTYVCTVLGCPAPVLCCQVAGLRGLSATSSWPGSSLNGTLIPQNALGFRF